MSITVYTLDGQFTSPLDPPPPLHFVLRDWERSDFTGEILRPNLPCVFRCGELDDNSNGHFTKLPRDWQFFMFDLASYVVYNGRYHQELTQAEYDWLANRFAGVFGSRTAFNNQGHGFDDEAGNANFIKGIRLDAPLPAIYTLVCGGASLSGTIVTNNKGVQMMKVDHFDGTNPPPPVVTIDPYTDPRVFFATTITGINVDGGYRVFRFPQYDGKDVPVPLIASRDIYYPVGDMRAAGTQKPSPYFP